MGTTIPEHYVYLDWAATTPLCDEALDAMRPYLVSGPFGALVDANANSLHSPGRAAFERLEQARRRFAAAVGASRPNEIMFTGGATEADNAALVGLVRARVQQRAQQGRACKRPRIITTRLEHEAILKCAARMERDGYEVAYAACDRRGFVSAESLERELDDDTVLVSIQAANSEIGSIQPIRELAAAVHARGVAFHTDASQALGKMPLRMDDLGVDAATFAAHKICAPKGVGALYVRSRTPFEPFLAGGGQESGRRSGTQNVCGIAGFTAACEVAVALQAEEAVRQRLMRDRLYAQLAVIPQVEPTIQVDPGSEDYLPNIVHVLVNGMESETLILRLDQMGFGVSGGSACSSHSLEPSHVLTALGIDADRAYGSLRISFGRYTTQDDLDAFAQALAACITG